MKILFTICGRAGSKGIKGKNVRDFVERPLALYSLSAIELFVRRHPEHECQAALNTDSRKLQEIIGGSGLAKSMPVSMVERRESLAGDRVGKAAVLLDTLEQMESRSGTRYDMVVDLDITSPLRTVADVGRLVAKKAASGCDVVYSVTESRRNPYFNMVRKTDRGYEKVLPSDFVSRQQAPPIYDLNASLYAYAPAFLRSGKNVLEGWGEIIEMLDTGVLDLDKPSDFELMEVIGAWLFEKKPEFREIRDNIR